LLSLHNSTTLPTWQPMILSEIGDPHYPQANAFYFKSAVFISSECRPFRWLFTKTQFIS